MTHEPNLKLGEQLKKAREFTGYNLTEVGEYLKIRPLYLKALEDEDFDKIPGSVYVVGFIRTYADFLKLDSEELIRLYKRDARGIRPPADPITPIPVRESNMPGKILVKSSLISMFIILFIYNIISKDEKAELYRSNITAVPTTMIEDTADDNENIKCLPEYLTNNIPEGWIVYSITDPEKYLCTKNNSSF